MKAVRVSRGHRLSHCDFRASTINTQQVLPCLLWDLTIVCTLRGEKKNNNIYWPSEFHFTPISTRAAVYLAWAVCVLLSWHLFCCCRWGQEALRKQMIKNMLRCNFNAFLYLSNCKGHTIVFALHKALPLSEPLHADAQDHSRSLLRLKLFVQLQTRDRCSSNIQHKAWRCKILPD